MKIGTGRNSVLSRFLLVYSRRGCAASEEAAGVAVDAFDFD